MTDIYIKFRCAHHLEHERADLLQHAGAILRAPRIALVHEEALNKVIDRGLVFHYIGDVVVGNDDTYSVTGAWGHL